MQDISYSDKMSGVNDAKSQSNYVFVLLVIFALLRQETGVVSWTYVSCVCLVITHIFVTFFFFFFFDTLVCWYLIKQMQIRVKNKNEGQIKDNMKKCKTKCLILVPPYKSNGSFRNCLYALHWEIISWLLFQAHLF